MNANTQGRSVCRELLDTAEETLAWYCKRNAELFEALKRAQWELNDIAQHGGRAGDESMKMIAEALAKAQL